MSFVDTIVEQLAKTGFENTTKPQIYDTSDTTFAKLLEKQLSVKETESQQNLLGEIGIPSDLVIEPYDPANLNIANEPQNKFNNNIDISDVEIKDFTMGNYFDDFMKNPTQKESALMNMAMKYAADMYGTQGKNFVTDIVDLADGLTGRL